jgi:phage shock protein E
MENCITKQELEKLIENKVKFQLVDVRSEEEFNELHIPIATNFSIEKIDSDQNKLDKEILIVTTCGKGGGRSENASRKLQDLGFKASYLCGGTFGWFEK